MILSQKKGIKKFETQSTEIEISTLGLDDFILENSTSGFIEIILFAENIEEQHILYKEEYNLVKIQFEIPDNNLKETVFRKFITKRLKRASAVIKIPKGKKATIFGNEINIESKSYKGNLKIFIEKGIVKLNAIKANVSIKLYAGNVYASLEKANIEVVSNIGKIKIDENLFKKKYEQNEENCTLNFKINSIKANIFLRTK